MKVVNDIKVHEFDSVELTVGNSINIRIVSHERRSDLVIIDTGSEFFTVNGSELIMAIKNAQNTSR